ncbi:MAG: type II toxin-antitoxin system RelE/ParE family toxin [Calditrichia bacterium]|nr:type II toxin-antitoxin system RelE/ParE family toxin [Calditrichia bacterium]
MKIIQSRSFQRKVKKFIKREKKKLDEEIRKIIDNPSIGSEKKGDLRGVFVHKFKIQTNQYLLAYRFFGENLELIMIGPHEKEVL